jgi:hypothetical protein
MAKLKLKNKVLKKKVLKKKSTEGGNILVELAEIASLIEDNVNEMYALMHGYIDKNPEPDECRQGDKHMMMAIEGFTSHLRVYAKQIDDEMVAEEAEKHRGKNIGYPGNACDY